MRKIIATARASLNGVMQGPGAAREDTSDGFDLGGWVTKFRMLRVVPAVMSLVGTLDKPYDLLLGRKTYDIFSGHWPKVPADDPIGPVFTKANKYVLIASEHIVLTSRRTGQRGGDRVCHRHPFHTPVAAVWSRPACEQLIQLRELFG